MPIELLGVIAVAVAILLAVGALVLVRRRLGVAFLERHNDVAGNIYGVLGVIYGVLLAFVVGTVWQRYVDAREIVEQEANALADLYRSAAAYPDSVGRRLRATLETYAQVVPEQEWGEGARRIGSDQAWHAYNALWREYLAYSPATERGRIWHQESVRHLNALGDNRRLRLLHSQPAIPPLLWVVLYVVGVVTVAFSYFFGVQNVWSHALMTGALAGTIGLILGLLMALEHPFDGLARVQPQAFGEVLQIIER